jgi:hypothetical protein
MLAAMYAQFAGRPEADQIIAQLPAALAEIRAKPESAE